jgi:HEPN domain-containing protein
MLLRKAAADETLLDRIVAAAEVDDEIVGFHCQQAVEKYLKAWLSDLAVNYPKTHNLQTLVELLEANGKTVAG